MDKPKKTNRFFSTPSSNKKQQHLLKHSGSKDGGDVEVVMERSKRKEKVKGLSSIGSAAKENSQMGGGGGSDDGEEELLLKTSATAAKRFKVHSKPLNDCNAIDLAVVPRKIRSAMIKRNRESLSPPLPEAKKPHRTPNGTHQPHLSSTQKAKQKMLFQKQGVPGQLECIPITKDEEEVAETLFALARMIPDKPVNYRVDQKNTEAKPSPVRRTTEVPMLASEALKNESAKSLKEDIIVEATNIPSSVEGSGSDAGTVNFLPDTSMMHRPSIIRNSKFMLDRGIIGPLSDSRISQFQKNEHTDLTSLSVASTSGVLINPCHTNSRLQGTQHKASLCDQKTELWPVAAILKKQEEHSMKENNDGDKRFPSCMEGTPALSLIEGNNHNGSGLGLSLAGSRDRELAWSSESKVPSWLNSAKKPDLAGDGVLKEKVNSVLVGKTQPWKKCTTHVHISRLISVHQASEEKSMLPPTTNQMLPNGTKHGASAPSSLNGLISLSDKNGLNRFISIDGCLSDGDAGTNMHEVRNRILRDKQNRDFLSLSTGGSLGSAAPFNAVNQRTNKLDSSVQFHVPYLHSVAQNPSPVPFNVHGRSSSLYPDHLTVRATQQLKSEQMASPFCSPQHAVHANSANHHHHHQQQQQQQQQQMWAAHYMSGRNSTASYSSNWQHGKQDSPIYIPGECSQPPAHSSSSLRHEGFSAKFPSNMQLQQQQQQQQQLFFLSSLSASSSRGKMHHPHHHPHHLAGGYDGASGGSMLTARLT
ncbi:uncharacterized protein LOC113357136 isoform X2 [Papaver somniferum]|uniref:uncharacterized protein LOC113357136 isoform X2 n=1 Tax=Papaver somniferum TaxID=3469 RepID=UPI000E6FD408|nr:uncharacterized protein LOC113357136 isoform X2 [Papaver somniferum]